MGGDRFVARLDRALRDTASALYRLEERVPQPPNAQQRMRGEPAITQFGRMCAKLGIRIIAASSPQAKGHVERAHGTHQDRAGEETAAGRDRQLRTGQCVSGSALSRRPQPSLRAPGGEERRLSPAAAGSGRRRGNWTKCSGWRSNA